MLEDEQFKTKIRPEWIETIARTNAFERPDDFVMDWKTYFKMLPKGRDVLRTVSRASGYSTSKLASENAERWLVPWRHMVIYICVEYLDFSKSKAGRIVNRDHSAASYACEAFRDRLDNSGKWRLSLEKVLRAL